MAFALNSSEKAPVVDENGATVPEGATTVTITDPTIVNFAIVSGDLFLVAGLVGTTTVVITPTGGTGVSHDVTVSQAFDWSLGTPVAK